MNENKVIKEALEKRLKSEINQNSSRSFIDYLNQNLKRIEESEYSSNEWKIYDINSTKELLNNVALTEKMEELRCSIPDAKSSNFQESLEELLMNSLNSVAGQIQRTNENYELNLLFIEHDYNPESFFFGYDDHSYDFKLLSGKEYLKFDYKKCLFEGAGQMDCSELMAPLWNLEDELNIDDDYESLEGFLQDLKDLNISNLYYGLHLCLERISQDVFNLGIPMKDKVYIFGNEHDCEQRNIYSLKKE